MTAALAHHSRQEAQRVTDPSKPTRRRPLGVSRARQTVGQLTSGREEMRQARAHAEAWYQALRHWETRQTEELVPRTLIGSGGAGRMVAIVGNYGRGQATLHYTLVSTPLGWLSESAVAQAMSRSGEELLEPLRRGRGLASLCAPRGGWHPHKADAVDYALAVLKVAVLLGDGKAFSALQTLKDVISTDVP